MGETDNMGSQEMVAGVGGLRRVEYQQEGEVDTRGLGGVELVVGGETGQQQEGLEHQEEGVADIKNQGVWTM